MGLRFELASRPRGAYVLHTVSRWIFVGFSQVQRCFQAGATLNIGRRHPLHTPPSHFTAGRTGTKLIHPLRPLTRPLTPPKGQTLIDAMAVGAASSLVERAAGTSLGRKL